MVNFHFCQIKCLQKWRKFSIREMKLLRNLTSLQYLQTSISLPADQVFTRRDVQRSAHLLSTNLYDGV